MDKKLVEMYEQALEVEKETSVPAIVALAQAVLETGWGRYIPIDYKTSRNSRNLFGIKWDGYGDYVEAWTREEIDGKLKPVLAKFKAFPSYIGSFRFYAELMQKYPYRPCLDEYIVDKDLGKYVRCIAKHYATDSKYAEKVLRIIDMLKTDLKGVMKMQPNKYRIQQKEFTDAKESMKKAGIFKPYGEESVYWTTHITREELAVILTRLLKKLQIKLGGD